MALSHLIRVALICNGAISDYSIIKEKIQDYPYVVAVDGGANHCYAMHIEPQLIFGDLDSVQPNVISHFKHINQQQFPTDKDETDLELALNFLNAEGVAEITIFGGTGGRTDHLLTNLIMLTRFPGKVFLESEAERIFALQRSTHLRCSIGQTLSLIPINGPAVGIVTNGLKWELNEATLDKDFIGISNVALKEDVIIHVREGDLLCFINK